MPEAGAPELAAAAATVLGEWDLAGARLTLIGQIENTVFRVDGVDRSVYVLRIHRAGYHTLGELESEQLWTEALNAAGIGAPRRQRTRAGQRYARIALGAAAGQRHVGLGEWLHGESMGRLMERDASTRTLAGHFRQLGALAARIDNQAAAWHLPAGFTRHALDADGLMGEHPWWGRFWESAVLDAVARTELLALRARLHEWLSTLARTPDQYSLIHADLHPGNILVDGDRLHVIDFDDAGFGWHAYELAIALYRHKGHPDHAVLRDALVAGYRMHRPLADAAVALLPGFFLVRTLALIGWIADRPEIGLDERARCLAQEMRSLDPRALDRLLGS